MFNELFLQKKPINKRMAKKPLSQQTPQNSLSQQEADDLLALAKEREKRKTYYLPLGGEKLQIPIISCNKEHRFTLDINSSRLIISKYTFQTRLNVIELLRLDINGHPHTNPDAVYVGRTHIHRYKEGCGLDWAEALPESFGSADILELLDQFMNDCTIMKKPKIKKVSLIKTLFDDVND